MLTGDDVYRTLCDLDLTLQDIRVMGHLKLLLGGVDADHPALAQLAQKAQDLNVVLKRLADAHERGF